MKTIDELLNETTHDFDSLISIMNILRSPEGCPWDREQSHVSIRKCLIEETYEVVEAIDKNDVALLKEELGDLMFQVVFHSQIENEKGNFDITGVIHDICAKMIYRHPHVFNTINVKDSKEVSVNWDNLKKKEKNINSISDSLKKVPPSLPALLKAQKVIGKARNRLGFDSNKTISADRTIAEEVFVLCDRAEREGIDLEKELNDVTDNFIRCAEEYETQKTI